MSYDEAPTGPAWRPTGHRRADKHKPTSMEGYYFWFMQRSESKQKRLFKYALGRLARDHPDKDPREVLLEFFAESIYEYEQYHERLRKGQVDDTRSRQQKSLRALGSLLSDRASQLRASNIPRSEEQAIEQAEKATGSFRVASTSHRRIEISFERGSPPKGH